MNPPRAIAVAALLAALALVGCGSGEDASPETPTPTAATADVAPALYEPPAAEPYANGKRLAGRTAQRLLTFAPGATAKTIATSVRPAGMGQAELERIVQPLVHEDGSAAEVEYVQLSGVTSSSLGAMVVARQERGGEAAISRVFDIRLARSSGPWQLDRVASVGGEELERPPELPAAAEAVLDDPAISLPDSARWDIYARRVDPDLLRALSQAARSWGLAVTVLKTGHPANVWGTTRRSAHTSGYAADIYAVNGRLVIKQRGQQGAAYGAAASFLEGGAVQVGSPWLFTAAPGQSFTDEVHQDHVHLQQSSAL